MRVMAVDLGDVRTGIALSDETGFLASPLCVIEERHFKARVKKVCAKARETGAAEVVIGYPKNMDGSIGARAEKAAEFAELARAELAELKIPVILWDERNTTISAANYLNTTNTRGKKRKEVIDKVAAVIILQSYLDK